MKFPFFAMLWFDASLLALEVLPQLTAPTGEPIPMNLDCFGAVVTGCVGFRILHLLVWRGTLSERQDFFSLKIVQTYH